MPNNFLVGLHHLPQLERHVVMLRVPIYGDKKKIRREKCFEVCCALGAYCEWCGVSMTLNLSAHSTSPLSTCCFDDFSMPPNSLSTCRGARQNSYLRPRFNVCEFSKERALTCANAHWQTICARQLERCGASSTLIPLMRSSSIVRQNLRQ